MRPQVQRDLDDYRKNKETEDREQQCQSLALDERKVSCPCGSSGERRRVLSLHSFDARIFDRSNEAAGLCVSPEALKIGADFGRVLVAQLAVFLQRLVDDALEF